ncbi:MAG: hypothetical protein AAFQ41_15365, partial [Cyanobacteria bacterium J06623_7]
MLLKKLSILSISIILSCGYVRAAQAGVACQDKYSNAAFGRLEKRDLDHLKQKYVDSRQPIKNREKVTLSLYDVQRILGFSGQQIKIANGGRVEHRIWLNRDNCKRKVKAAFRDGKLVKIILEVGLFNEEELKR